MKLWKKNILLIFAVIVILSAPMFIVKNAEFSGTDELAVQQIKEIDPEYKPWFKPLLEPASGEVESLLFALQAAIGAGIVGFVLGRITTKKSST